MAYMDIGRFLTAGWNYVASIHPFRPGPQPELRCRTPSGMYLPSYADVCVARAMLKALGLPTELVLDILDYAQYEPILEVSSQGPHIASANVRKSGVFVGAQICLDIPVLTKETLRQLCARSVTPKVREIEFRITSQDQGFSSVNTPGTYETFSWLEASILRPLPGAPSPPGLPARNLETPRHLHNMFQEYCELVRSPPEAEQGGQAGEGHFAWYLQGNCVAETDPLNYRIVWGKDYCECETDRGAGEGTGFIEALQEGDRVLIWARAKVCLDSDAIRASQRDVQPRQLLLN